MQTHKQDPYPSYSWLWWGVVSVLCMVAVIVIVIVSQS